VDLRTDYLPGLEFAEVQLEVEGADTVLVVPVAAGVDFLRGERLTTLDTAGQGTVLVRGALVTAAGAVLAERTVSARLSGRSTLTLLFSRSCELVECPLDGAPGATECQGGVCVPPDCSPETPDACGPAECAADGDCPPPVAACAAALCVEGTCFEGPVEGRCANGEVCHPTVGCLEVGPTDAGMPDAGQPDAGPPPQCATDDDCDDGLFCNGVERCFEGTCAPGGGAPDCDDGVDCTRDDCDDGAGVCVNEPDDGLCTASTGGTCSATGCQYPSCTAATCTAGPCQTAVCEGDVCVRTNLCDGDQTCCGGSCVAPGCDDGNPCTDDSCGATGCVNAPNTNLCSDGNPCTSRDECSGGTCQGGRPTLCTDGNLCTTDSCDPSTGCRFTPVAEGTSCGDDVCGTFSPCRGSCSNGTQTRFCRPQTCDAAGLCVEGDPVADSQGCAIPDGDACTTCGGTFCGGGPTQRCIGTCFGGCCTDGL